MEDSDILNKEFKSNSNKTKEQEKTKKIEKVVTGNVVVKKKSEIQKFTDTFLSEDISNVKNYILKDVLIPSAKKLLHDVITGSADMFLYGEKMPSQRSTSQRISYASFYDKKPLIEDSIKSRTRNYDEVIISSRGEAEEVIERMDELVETYGSVSVADYFDLLGMTGRYTDNNYGWRDIRSAKVVRTLDGWCIKLPKAEPLK